MKRMRAFDVPAAGVMLLLAAAGLAVFLAVRGLWIPASLASAAFGLGVFLFRQAFGLRKSLRDIVAQLERISAGDRSSAVLVGAGKGLDELVDAVNKLAEAYLASLSEKRKAEENRRRFFANVSHDIRTPLTSIVGYIDALRDRGAEEEAGEYLAILHDKASALKRRIDDMFLLSKIESDDAPLVPVALDLAECARECLIDFLPEIEAKSIAAEFRLPDEAVPIKADKSGLLRAVGNVVSNALAYGADGAYLGVSIEERPGHFCLVVEDRGEGLDPEECEAVFDRLYRGESVRRKHAGGSGLGLAIARRLMERMGGFIACESRPRSFTRFILGFPK